MSYKQRTAAKCLADGGKTWASRVIGAIGHKLEFWVKNEMGVTPYF